MRYLSIGWALLLSVVSFSQEDSIALSIEELFIYDQKLPANAAATFHTLESKDIAPIYYGQDPVSVMERISPSIVSSSDGAGSFGNYTSFRLRGMPQSRINVGLNGVPLNDMLDQSIFFSNMNDILNSIDEVQIQHGLAMGQKGIASYAGAINLNTTAAQKNNSKLAMGIGSFGALRHVFETQHRSENGIGIRGRFTRASSQGYKDNSGSESYSAFFNSQWAKAKSLWSFTAFTGKTQNGQAYLGVPQSVIDEDPTHNANGLNDIDDFQQHHAQLKYAYALSDELSWSTTAYINQAQGEFPFTVEQTQFVFGLENNHYGLMTQLHGMHHGWQWNIGLHGYLFDRLNYDYTAPLRSQLTTEDHTDKNEISLQSRASKTWGSWTLNADLQIRTIALTLFNPSTISDPRSLDWTFVNAIGGIAFEPTPQQKIYTSIGTSGREPTRDDILNGADQSERVWDWEMGYHWGNEWARLEGNLFYMQFDNEIVEVGALQERSYIEIRQNVPSTQRYGAELSGSLHPHQKWRIGLHAMHLYSNIDQYSTASQDYEDVSHVFSPQWLINPSLTYTPMPQLSIGLDTRYMSEVYTELSNNPEFTIPAYWVLNSSINYQLTPRLQLAAQFNNITNEQYFTNGQPLDTDGDNQVDELGLLIQAPFHVFFNLSYQFGTL